MIIIRILLARLRLFLLFIYLIQATTGNGQTCSSVFNKTYGGSGNDEALFVLSTSDNGSLVGGRTTSGSAGNYDAFLMKVSESGVIEWSRNYGGLSYDDITRVRSVPAGGYIAIGMTRSFGNANGETFLLKTTANGTPEWTIRFSSTGTGRERPKDIMVLQDGSYAFLINRNDSTAQADGLVCRMSATGTITWCRVFDNGDDDGFNTLVEEGDSLVVGGHAKIDQYDAILMKLHTTDGSVFWSKKYVHIAGHDDEILNIELLPGGGGLAFSATELVLGNAMGSGNISHFKRLNNGQHSYETSSLSSLGGSLLNMVSRQTQDGGFIYMMNADSPNGYASLTKLDRTGLPQFGRDIHITEFFNNSQRMMGLDTTAVGGYWAAGYAQIWPETTHNIRLYKMDPSGGVGVNCVRYNNGGITDTVHYTITDFTWSDVGPGLLTPTQINLTVTDNNFGLTDNICDTVYCAPLQNTNDSCKATFLTYLRGQGKVDLLDAEVANDGGTITVGSINNLPFITKITPGGSVAWSRSYTEFFSTSFFKKIIPTGDSNYLVIAISSTVLNHGASAKSLLIKVDDNGNIIWSKNYIFEGDLDIYNAISTEDGGFIICANFGFGIGYTFSYLMRLSSTGEIVWKKQIHHQSGSPLYKQLYLDGNSLYVATDNYLPRVFFRVEKWNAITGQMVWNQRFFVDINNTNVYTGLVTKIGDTVYVMLHTFEPIDFFTTNVNIVVCKLDDQGNLLGNSRLRLPNHSPAPYAINLTSEHKPFCFLQSEDNNFIVAQQANPISDKSVVITKFTPAGTVLWSRSYPNLKNHLVWSMKNNGSNILLSGEIEVNQVLNLYSGFVMKTDHNGVIKTGATGLCQSDSAGATMDVQPGVLLAWNDMDSVTNENHITITPAMPDNGPVAMDVFLQCSLSSNCTLAQLSGQDTICNLSDTLTYSIQRNLACTAPAEWIIDTSFVKIIQTTDTLLKVKYKKSGNTFIRIKLNSGCSVMTTEKTIKIFKNASQMNLGADTVICAGSTVILNAHRGFAFYQWQDGSSDSLYTVTQPGTYYADVTDSCGRLFRDSVLVSPHPPIPFDAGIDRNKCNNDTLHLSAPAGFLNYTWSPAYNISSVSAQNVAINPSGDTAYFIRAEKTQGCFVYDTVYVKVFHSPVIDLGFDKSFCQGDSILFNAGNGFNQYVWNNGNSTMQIAAHNSGTYSVIGTTTEGCLSYDTVKVINVYPLPVVRLNHDSTLCTGDSRVLDAGIGFVSYRWNNGSISNTISVNSIGLFAVKVADNNGCQGSDSVMINTILPLPSAYLPIDTAICSYGMMELKPMRTFNQYLWSNSATTSVITISQPGLYWLQVIDNKNCTGKDSILVNPKECVIGFFIPSAFTPNKDGKNDTFKPLLLGNVSQYRFIIYNRWGQVVFQTNEINKGWDGGYAGTEQDTNVFAWLCTYQLAGEEIRSAKGTVVLIR